MIPSFLLASLSLLPSLGAIPQQESIIEVASTLDRVTVYPGQALAERVVEIQATQVGPLTVSVGPLPLAAEASSFQTEVMDGDVVVQGLELRRRTGSSADWAEADALRDELKKLRWEERLQLAEMKGIEASRASLTALLQSQAQDPASGGLLPDDLGERLTYFREQMTAIDKEAAHTQLKLEELRDAIDDLENQLDPLTHGAKRDYREARLSLFVERVGTVRLRLSYLVEGAWWEPAYDVRVAPDLSGVNVGLVGQVSQRTGEDWMGVELLLSTSMPNLGLDPPALPSRYFHIGRERGRAGLMSLGYSADAAPAEEIMDKAFAPEVMVRDFGITTQFVLPGESNVRGNGESHRFRIRELPLEVRPERYVVPSLSDKAYLRAKVSHTGEAPLLPGTAKIFLGPDYLGEASFPMMRQGDSTLLNLGIDPNLTVDYEMLEDLRDNPGRFSLSDTATITRRYRARLRLSASARGQVTVLVEEALPMSWDDRIEVEVDDLQPRPLAGPDDMIAREERGVYRWRLQVAPGSTHSVRWGYEISFDEDLDPVLSEN
ncbi:MAG: mucoidy inhibitor MuiA family protein [Planctomycetota bacterium]